MIKYKSLAKKNASQSQLKASQELNIFILPDQTPVTTVHLEYEDDKQQRSK